MDITQKLFDMQDIKYRDFTSKLIPNISPDSMIGVRLPQVKKLAKEIYKSGEYINFVNSLPHTYFEEYHLHCYIISEIKDFEVFINELERLLPYIDNWSVCDSLRPKCFAKNKEKALIYIKKWLKSDKIYTQRFAIEMLMVHFLDEDFSTEYPDLVSKTRGEDYYLKMMVAWYFATALAKQYDEILPFIEKHRIKDKWTHNKAIQKAVESYRVSDDKKAHLKCLKY
ncbi:MAG: DNA alkylation repair protein [Clostridia bacterium]|nr:DNA alkylation repair protein [Clostridia bacterium]